VRHCGLREPNQLPADKQARVAYVTQTAPGETIAESSTSNIVSNPAALPAVGGQHQTRLAGVTTIHR
jgi:hypothetical protein